MDASIFWILQAWFKANLLGRCGDSLFQDACDAFLLLQRLQCSRVLLHWRVPCVCNSATHTSADAIRQVKGSRLQMAATKSTCRRMQREHFAVPSCRKRLLHS